MANPNLWFHQYINDTINERLKSALATDQQKAEEMEKEEDVQFMCNRKNKKAATYVTA